MKVLIVTSLALLLFGGCAGEPTSEVTATDVTPTTTTAGTSSTPASVTAPDTTTAAETANAVETATTESAAQTPVNENHDSGTWAGQLRVAQPVSMLNYVGAESGDYAPMRFRNDSAAGKKLLATCADDDRCEFTGVVEWLDETPPDGASAVGQIVSVESVRRLPAGQQ
jgi:hypothetical protein